MSRGNKAGGVESLVDHWSWDLVGVAAVVGFVVLVGLTWWLLLLEGGREERSERIGVLRRLGYLVESRGEWLVQLVVGMRVGE